MTDRESGGQYGRLCQKEQEKENVGGAPSSLRLELKGMLRTAWPGGLRHRAPRGLGHAPQQKNPGGLRTHRSTHGRTAVEKSAPAPHAPQSRIPSVRKVLTTEPVSDRPDTHGRDELDDLSSVAKPRVVLNRNRMRSRRARPRVQCRTVHETAWRRVP